MLNRIEEERGAIQGICLHPWLFDDGSKVEWLRVLLREIRDRKVLKMGDLEEGLW